MWKRIIAINLVILTIILSGCKSQDKVKKEINISVAASLLEPIEEIVNDYEKAKDIKVNINTGGSGELKNQIIQGADIGLFFSANKENVDDLVKAGLVNNEDKSNIIYNSLVLIKNNSNKNEGNIVEVNSLLDLEKVQGTIAIGETSLVPAGEYAKESLNNVGAWTGVEDKIIYGKSVNVVKTYVDNGNCDYGFIYKSDAMTLKNSIVIYEVPENYHKRITYSIAVLKGYREKEECNKLMEYIKSQKSLEVFKKYGFIVGE